VGLANLCRYTQSGDKKYELCYQMKRCAQPDQMPLSVSSFRVLCITAPGDHPDTIVNTFATRLSDLIKAISHYRKPLESMNKTSTPL
jgi:hypothetical protein